MDITAGISIVSCVIGMDEPGGEIEVDRYAVSAGWWDLIQPSAQRAAALRALSSRVRPEVGPLLDVGAGSGSAVLTVLADLPECRALALEPSRAMRSLLLSKIAAQQGLSTRITVRPEDFFGASLPERIGGALLLGVIGHFDAGERAAVLAELAARLPAGGAALIDLPEPRRPHRVPADERTVATVGELTYRLIAEARPLGTELMHWRITYLTLEGDRVLIEDTVDFQYRHPAVEVVAEEARAVGLGLETVSGGHWLLTRT